ncbi:MAG: biotin-independent malonate decarboxylase subunit gamma [Betaproteobacteria bacterium]
MFADLPLQEQLEAWLGPDACRPVEPRTTGDVLVLEAKLDHYAFVAVAFDYTRQHGSIGPREATQLALALDRATTARMPLVFLMNTSGMRVTEGMETVVALRRLLRALLDAKLSGQRMFATVTRYAFGGASIIASLCDRRTMHADALLGMSGPKLIENIAGSAALRAADRNAVRALLGGAARAAVTPTTTLCEDLPGTYRDALSAWLVAPPAAAGPDEAIAAQARLLRARLGDRALAPSQRVAPDALDATTVRVLARWLGNDAVVARSGAFLSARASGDDTAIAFGLVGGAVATAPLACALADGLLGAAQGRSPLRIAILADVENHSADPADEAVVLSEYLAHLALTLRWVHRCGHEVHVIVTGVAGGGIFAALAAGATRVSMLPHARIQVLSPAALAALDKRADGATETLAAALAAGAIDSSFGPVQAHV